MPSCFSKTKFSSLPPVVQQFCSLNAFDLHAYRAKYNCVKLSPSYAVTGLARFMESALSPPEGPRIGACKLILIVELGWCWRVSAPSCFPFLRSGPALRDLPLEELLHLRGKKGLHCSSGGSSGKKTVFLLYEENNRRAIMDFNFNSINNLSLLLSHVCKKERKYFFLFRRL